MWSFIASVVVFAVLILGLRLWRYQQRKKVQDETATIDQHIHDVADIAQRRHVQRFGRASTDLTNAFSNGAAVPKP